MENLKNVDRACFPNLVNVFAGTNPGYNWKMEDGTTPGNNASTKIAYDRLTGTVTTTFDSDNFKGGSDLAIAKTILHESVHAYLVAYFGVDQSSAKLTYSEYMDAFRSSTDAGNTPDLNQMQHDVMVNRLIGGVASNLIAFGKSKGYNLPDQFYYDLSWGGLTETSAFKNLNPSVQNRIKDVIVSEQSGKDSNGNTSPPKGNTSGGC